MRRLAISVVALVLALQGLQLVQQTPLPVSSSDSSKDTQAPSAADHEVPLLFEANRGQAPADVDFIVRGDHFNAGLKASGAEMALKEGNSVANLGMSFAGGSEVAELAGARPTTVQTNYFIGDDPDKWTRDVPSFGAVRYDQVYPGIDVLFHARDRVLEYDFVLQPGAEPSDIGLEFTGAEALRLDHEGNLVIETAAGDLTQGHPVAYQNIRGERRSVPAQFVISSNDRVRISLGAYDPSKKLVIDPPIVYSTYIGGNSEDVARSLAIDGDGNAYVWGTAVSTDFPTTAGAFDPTDNGGEDAFLAKFDEDGDPVYVTYLGGSNGDSPPGMPQRRLIGVDDDGNAIVAGNTFSSDFPLMNAFDSTFGGTQEEAFVTKFDDDGDLVYSTFLGGTGDDGAFGVDVDGDGNAFISGKTESADNNGGGFPVTVGAFQTTFQGGAGDAFVTALTPTGTAIYSTYLGGGTNCPNCAGDDTNGADEIGKSIATDGDGNAFVTGNTASSDFPTMSAFDDNNNGDVDDNGNDAFVTGFGPTGAVLYSTFLGGNAQDNVVNIDAAPNGDAFVTGTLTIGTQSGEATFPKDNAFDSSCKDTVSPAGDDEDNLEGFVAGFESDGTVIYSSCLGGRDADQPKWIAVDEDSHAYVTGRTDSQKGFPLRNAFDNKNRRPQEECQGTPPVCSTDTDEEPSDGFVTKIDPDARIGFSTYMGGDGNDAGVGIASGPMGRVFVTGDTAVTDQEDFPTTGDTRRNFRGKAAWLGVFQGPGNVVTSSYLDGHGGQFGLQILGDPQNAYVMGAHEFDANEGEPDNFPMRNAHDNTSVNQQDEPFLTKLAIPPRICAGLRQGETLVAGTDGPNTLVGTPGPDLICAFGGNDVARGLGGKDRIFLAGGNDRGAGGKGSDFISGAGGRDRMLGAAGGDRIKGGDGRDRGFGGGGRDNVKGGDGNDFVRGRAGNDRVFGQAGNDTARGGPGGDDKVSGGGGRDDVHAGNGVDVLTGGSGDDRVESEDGNDRLSGNDGDDVLLGRAGRDRLNGNSGNDVLRGGRGHDVLSGGPGNDNCINQPGNDTQISC